MIKSIYKSSCYLITITLFISLLTVPNFLYHYFFVKSIGSCDNQNCIDMTPYKFNKEINNSIVPSKHIFITTFIYSLVKE